MALEQARFFVSFYKKKRKKRDNYQASRIFLAYSAPLSLFPAIRPGSSAKPTWSHACPSVQHTVTRDSVAGEFAGGLLDETLGLCHRAVFTYSRHSHHKVRGLRKTPPSHSPLIPPPAPNCKPSSRRSYNGEREKKFSVLIFCRCLTR